MMDWSLIFVVFRILKGGNLRAPSTFFLQPLLLRRLVACCSRHFAATSARWASLQAARAHTTPALAPAPAPAPACLHSPTARPHPHPHPPS